MKIVPFIFYYTKLLIGVTLGVYKTAEPINIKWRWKFWQHKYYVRRR